MISIYLFYLLEIICLNTFLEFFSFVYVTSKLSILSNYTKHPKRLTLYYMLYFFYKYQRDILLSRFFVYFENYLLRVDKQVL